MTNIKGVFRCGAAFLALQAVPATCLAAAPAGAGPVGPAAAVPVENADIVVTAQRRAERAQDVPIVITALSAERLEQLNITKPQDLYGNVPSLVSGTQGQASRDVQSYSIRGQSTGFLASPGVAVYMAEVPLPSSITLNLQGAPGQFVDLENVQVLSGPQGTLFGRNTTGGAVLLTPHKPTDTFGGYVEGSVGNYDLRGLEGALNIPIVGDKLIVRVAGAYQDRRGYTKDLVWNKWRDDTHWYTGRIGILLRPDDRFENYLLAYGTRSSNNGSGNILQGFNIAGLSSPGIGFCAEPPVPAGIAVSCDVYRRQMEIADEIGPRRTRGNVDGFSRISSWGIINTSSYRLTDELTLRNIVSFQKLKDNYATDQDATPIQQYEQNQHAREPNFPIAGFSDAFGLPLTGNYPNENRRFSLPRDYIKQTTEELQLQGDMLDHHLTFAVGGFYYDAKPAGLWGAEAVNFCPAAYTGLCAPHASRSGVTNKSRALYGQATLDLGVLTPSLEKLRITAGYRYTWDRISGFNQAYTVNPDGLTVNCLRDGTTPDPAVPVAALDACTFSARLKSKAPTWLVGIDYRPIQDLLLYAKISRGYKAGGFNTVAVRPETQTFQPEKLTTYEAGFKSDLRVADVPLRLNATYYYSDYSNIQRPGSDRNAETGAAGAAIFAAKARIQGIEAEASIRPARGVEIGGTLSYTDAKYKKYLVPASLPTLGCNGYVLPSGDAANPNYADFSCARFQFVSPWIYNIHGSFDIPIPDRFGKLSLFATYNHVSSQYTAPGPNEVGGLIKGYGLLNASLTWSDIGRSGIDGTLFATNIANKLYRVSNANGFNTLLVNTSLYGEPRMFGLKLRYRFGD